MKQQQIAWAAGLFEGDGCITATRHGSTVMSLTMTDYEPVARFLNIVGVGRVSFRELANEAHRDLWTWYCGRSIDVSRIFRLLNPYFSDYRKQQYPRDIGNKTINQRDPIIWMAWAAGLFEAEGSVSYTRSSNFQLRLGMCDETVVTRFQKIMRCGATHIETTNRNRPIYRWSVSTRRPVLRVIFHLWPYLSRRRHNQIAHAIACSLNGKKLQ